MEPIASSINFVRIKAAFRASTLHLALSAVVAVSVAAMVFFLWYPYPYGDLAGGRGLFTLIVSIDVICGPLLTLVIFSPTKKRKEIVRDIAVIAVIQLCALVYGVVMVWKARPLYLVAEMDRFKVISSLALPDDFRRVLPADLVPGLLNGPMTIGLRPPKDIEEKNAVMFESLGGGADYAERPDFYIPYDVTAGAKMMKRALPLASFIAKYPEQSDAANAIAKVLGQSVDALNYLPVIGRQDWVAVMDKNGAIAGFLKGDGF